MIPIKELAVFLLVIFTPTILKACDICGVGMSQTGIGLLANYKNNFIRLSYGISGFQSSLGHSVKIRDRSSTLSLTGRYSISEGLRLTATLPYGIAERFILSENPRKRGFGDLQIMANQTILRNRRCSEKIQIFWDLGLGLSVPSGDYDPRLTDQDLPLNLNIGRASWSVILQSNIVVNRAKSGIMLSTDYDINLHNENTYRLGDRFRLSTQFFRELNQNLTKVVVSLGIQYEQFQLDHHASGKRVENSEGYGIFNFVGLNFKRANYIIGGNISVPIIQNYSNKEVLAQNKFSCNFTYFIKSKNN